MDVVDDVVDPFQDLLDPRGDPRLVLCGAVPAPGDEADGDRPGRLARALHDPDAAAAVALAAVLLIVEVLSKQGVKIK